MIGLAKCVSETGMLLLKGTSVFEPTFVLRAFFPNRLDHNLRPTFEFLFITKSFKSTNSTKNPLRNEKVIQRRGYSEEDKKFIVEQVKSYGDKKETWVCGFGGGLVCVRLFGVLF